MLSPYRHFPYTRLRRLRHAPFIRHLVAETTLTPHNLIYPVFLTEEKQALSIPCLPGISQLNLNQLLAEAEQLLALNIPAIALFPAIALSKKTLNAEEAYQHHGLIPKAVRLLKQHFPTLGVMTDVALDPYTLHGQDGLLNTKGDIINDETIHILVKQALAHAEAGVDIIAPSDMMDGRIGCIRKALEQEGFTQTIILSYAVKYASHFYQPFRQAIGTQTLLGNNHKQQYQMDTRNSHEALHEVALDLAEGADIVMVKPGILCLDVIYRIKQTFQVPTFAYQVSGEYAMLHAASKAGWLDIKNIALETLFSIKRAGADAILTYFAKQVASWLA